MHLHSSACQSCSCMASEGICSALGAPAATACLQGTMQSEHLATLHSLRHLPQVLAGTADMVDQLMVADFLRAVQCQAVDAVINHVAAALQQVGSRR